MEDHELQLHIENLKTLIQIEKMNYSLAVKREADFETLSGLRDTLAKLRHELKILQDKV